MTDNMGANEEDECTFSKVFGREDQVPSFLEDVYGTRSTISYEEFSASMVDTASWIFSAPKIREKIFAAAEIEMRHFTDE